MINLLVYGLVGYCAYRFVKSWIGASPEIAEKEAPEADRASETELVKDPLCGVYFLRKRGVDVLIHGEWLSFCSPDCRDEYLRQHGRV